MYETLPEELQLLAGIVLARREQALECLRRFLTDKFECVKIRVHGNLHLRNIHYTGRDVMFVNFEGKPSRSLSERSLKRSCLRDVSDVMRSLHHAALQGLTQGSVLRPEDRSKLEIWADVWRVQASGAFLRAYFEAIEGTNLVPEAVNERSTMLEAFLLEKAFLELGEVLPSPPETAKALRAVIALLQ